MKRFCLSTLSTPAALLALSVALILPASAEPAERVPPAPGCMDARGLQEMNQVTPHTVSLRAADDSTWQVTFTNDCPGLKVSDKPRILAKDSWVCGTGNDYVVAGDLACPIASVQPISRRDFASEARQSDREPLTLPTVNVQQAKRTLRGSPSYCFDTRHVRGYGDNAKGFTVQTNPRRSGGNAEYVVEVSNNCRGLTHSPAVQFRSGFGTSLICGNSGDVVEIQAPTDNADRTGGLRTSFVGSGDRCDILAVYPAG